MRPAQQSKRKKKVCIRTQNGINIEMTTKVKKKGVFGISGSATKEKQSCLQLQDQEREPPV